MKEDGTKRMKTTLIVTLLLITVLIAPATHAAAQAKLAKEAWLFGLPAVMFEKQFDYDTYATKP
jgi:hypothetical protein